MLVKYYMLPCEPVDAVRAPCVQAANPLSGMSAPSATLNLAEVAVVSAHCDWMTGCGQGPNTVEHAPLVNTTNVHASAQHNDASTQSQLDLRPDILHANAGCHLPASRDPGPNVQVNLRYPDCLLLCTGVLPKADRQAAVPWPGHSAPIAANPFPVCRGPLSSSPQAAGRRCH